jgi:topoisomerase IA-like protein
VVEDLQRKNSVPLLMSSRAKKKREKKKQTKKQASKANKKKTVTREKARQD